MPRVPGDTCRCQRFSARIHAETGIDHIIGDLVGSHDDDLAVLALRLDRS